jgi:signal transduction histidine kinase
LKSYQEYTSLPAPELTVSSIKKLVSNVENLMKTQFSDTGIELNCDYPTEDFELLIDEQQIEQVLINLVKNAIEAFNSQVSKKVVLRAYQQYRYKIIEIEDNGPGIIPKAIDKIFVPFYTTKKTGSGIGLSLSRQLVRMNGGNLKDSSDPKKRTIFKVVF